MPKTEIACSVCHDLCWLVGLVCGTCGAEYTEAEVAAGRVANLPPPCGHNDLQSQLDAPCPACSAPPRSDK